MENRKSGEHIGNGFGQWNGAIGDEIWSMQLENSDSCDELYIKILTESFCDAQVGLLKRDKDRVEAVDKKTNFCDIGCGVGHVGSILKHRFGFEDLYAVEYSKKCVDQLCAGTVYKGVKHVTYVSGWDFQSEGVGQVDVVLCFAMFDGISPSEYGDFFRHVKETLGARLFVFYGPTLKEGGGGGGRMKEFNQGGFRFYMGDTLGVFDSQLKRRLYLAGVGGEEFPEDMADLLGDYDTVVAVYEV
eukprot:Nk52_evm10s241 gene=Nk52_evmTU10s241